MEKRASFYRWRLASLLVVGACAPVAVTEASSAPMNECTTSTTCDLRAGATCVQGRCETSVVPSFVLAVTLPSTALYAPNMTFLFRSEDFPSRLSATSKCPNKKCFILPRVTVFTGGVSLTEDTQARLGLQFPAGRHRVPVKLTAIPRWDIDGVPVDAQDVGLPVYPEQGAQFLPDESDPVTGYSLALSPMRYRFVFDAASEFAYRVPSVFQFRDVVPQQNTLIKPETISLGQGGAPLDPAQTPDPVLDTKFRDFKGFTAYLQYRGSGARASPTVRLAGKSTVVRFPLAALLSEDGKFVSAEANLNNTDLVIAPPEGALGVPTLKTGITTGRVLDTTYPELPLPIAVAGTVANSGGLPVQSRLYFKSTGVAILAGTNVSYMQYAAPLTTDAKGQFATILPPGTYKVYVEPLGSCSADDPSGCYGKLEQTITVNASQNLNFTVSERTYVHGTAVTFDQRKLGDADIIFAPAQLPAEDLFDNRLPPIAQPRAFYTRANRSGTFVGYLDSGTYDVIVKPTLGTNFPTTTSRIVVKPGEPMPELAPIVVKPPVRVSFNFRDAGDNPLEQAYLRAFVLRGGMYREVASASTDDAVDTAGNVTLLLPSGTE